MSKSGNIGGFTVYDGYLTGETQQDGGRMVFNAQSGYNAYINNNDGTFLGIGNVLPATTSIKAGAKFDIRTSNLASTNIGLILNAQGAGTNIALQIDNGGIKIDNGGISVSGLTGITGYVKFRDTPGINGFYNGIRVVAGIIVEVNTYASAQKPPLNP